jgi:hypothetical protein
MNSSLSAPAGAPAVTGAYRIPAVLPLPPLQTHDELLACPSEDGRVTRCRLRVFQSPATTPIVIVSELEDNPGPSITGAIEALCSAVWKKLNRPSEMIWIEHYRVKLEDGEVVETFDRVSFSISDSGARCEMTWDCVPLETLEQILGQDLS